MDVCDQPRFLSTRETAELLGCSPKSVYRLLDAGLLRPVRLTPRARLRFPRDEVEGLIERSREGS